MSYFKLWAKGLDGSVYESLWVSETLQQALELFYCVGLRSEVCMAWRLDVSSSEWIVYSGEYIEECHEVIGRDFGLG